MKSLFLKLSLVVTQIAAPVFAQSHTAIGEVGPIATCEEVAEIKFDQAKFTRLDADGQMWIDSSYQQCQLSASPGSPVMTAFPPEASTLRPDLGGLKDAVRAVRPPW